MKKPIIKIGDKVNIAGTVWYGEIVSLQNINNQIIGYINWTTTGWGEADRTVRLDNALFVDGIWNIKPESPGDEIELCECE